MGNGGDGNERTIRQKGGGGEGLEGGAGGGGREGQGEGRGGRGRKRDRMGNWLVGCWCFTSIRLLRRSQGDREEVKMKAGGGQCEEGEGGGGGGGDGGMEEMGTKGEQEERGGGELRQEGGLVNVGVLCPISWYYRSKAIDRR